MIAARDNPASQSLAQDIDAVARQYFFEAVKRQAVYALSR